MNYRLTKLRNGLRVVTSIMPSLESVTVTVWVRAGSKDEDEKTSGLAHFLEHMAFKGGRKFKTAKIISEVIDRMGAENNAGTSKEWTNFWIKTGKGNLKTALEVLADITLSPALVQKEIDKERGVIYEELSMYEDTPLMSIGEFFEENLYKGNVLGRKIGGERESLKNVNRRQFQEFRAVFYRPENMLISVAGGVDEKEVAKLAEKYFSTFKGTSFKGGHKPPVTSHRSPIDRLTLKTKANADQAHLMVGFKTEGRGYKGRFAQGVLSTILGKGMSSRLFTEVREKKGLAYAVRASQERYQDVGSFSVYAGVSIDKAAVAIDVIKRELFALSNKKKPIAKKELEKAKNSMIGRISLSLEDSSEVGDFFAEQILFAEDVLTPKELFEKIKKVSLDEVYFEARKIFEKEKMYLSIIGPYKDKKDFIKLLNN